MADAVHRIGPDRPLVECANILAARIGSQEVTDIGLRLQGEILSAEVDIMGPAAVHFQQLLHYPKLGIDQAVTNPERLFRFIDCHPLIGFQKERKSSVWGKSV